MSSRLSRCFVKLSLLSWWFCLAGQVFALDVSINERSLTIPAPPGYVEISEQFPQARRFAETLTPQMNRLLAVYLSQSDTSRLQAGQDATWERYMMIQVERQMQNATLDRADFGQVKQLLESQQKLLLAAVESQADRFLRNLTHGDGKPVGIDAGQSVPLGIFSDSDTHSSSTTLMHYAGQTSADNYFVIAATNVVHVADKLLFVYVYSKYAGKEDLDWVETMSKDWVASISRSNPPGGSLLSNIDWLRVLRHAFIGAIIAAFAWGFVMFVRHRNAASK